MSKFAHFCDLAEKLNRDLDLIPLLYGSLGLEQRLGMDLHADDIDILIPMIWLNTRWDDLRDFMEGLGYTLYDLHEHAFMKDRISVAFADIESLWDFAGIEIANIPLIRYNNSCYLLLELEDYQKVYAASSRDGYRKDKKHKDDAAKIRLIEKARNPS